MLEAVGFDAWDLRPLLHLRNVLPVFVDDLVELSLCLVLGGD